jgi:hypothetical protein
MENNTIDLDRLTQPLASNGSLVRAVIERFNTVFGGRWSFRIIEHQVRDSEVIVLGELSVDGVLRQQFGKATIAFDSDPANAPSLADHLAHAADDGLIQCAHAFGIPREGAPKQQSISPQSHPAPVEHAPNGNGNGNGDRTLTNRQLAAIFGFGKAAGMTQQDVISKAAKQYGREPASLTVAEASDLITELKNTNGKE